MTEINLSHLLEALHPLEKQVMRVFAEQDQCSPELLAKSSGLKPAQISSAIEWLLAKKMIVLSDEKVKLIASLTEIGEKYAALKNPPLRMAEEILERGEVGIRELQQRTDMAPEEKSKAIGALKSSGAVSVVSGGRFKISDEVPLSVFRDLQNVIDGLKKKDSRCLFSEFSAAEQSIIEIHHRKRSPSKGIFRVDEEISRIYQKTDLFAPVYEKVVSEKSVETLSELTPEILKEKSWQGKVFRKYNIQLPPSRISGGALHPYKVFLDQVKTKFVSMGFSEMRGPLVENEFWDMDALFMPQFHPAREIHDVYFVKDTPHDRSIPKDVVDRVAAAHEDGGDTGSRGWRYPFDAERTRRLILRSQGTSVSARILGAGAKNPGKYFSIARCFRYDQVDATHAPDFFQVEGIVLGKEIHFRTLLGLLTLFAKEVALAEEIKFLPAYFPFTEPSVEMHVRHPKLGWMELGGAGLFRPEVTGPLGVNVPVIAWGLGLDRMAMMALGISDIRDLFSSDLNMVREKQHINKVKHADY
ncbi:Phenylalanyl-tRNA synthetase alpha chain [hydrothermal vent metagenome]|uniref:phenylalanine--tRNA ligase n=1 Tax=hydrothermal vent metagenome TaxID=652676 RepID=A0A3B1CDF6_9ZZZZ